MDDEHFKKKDEFRERWITFVEHFMNNLATTLFPGKATEYLVQDRTLFRIQIPKALPTILQAGAGSWHAHHSPPKCEPKKKDYAMELA